MNISKPVMLAALVAFVAAGVVGYLQLQKVEKEEQERRDTFSTHMQGWALKQIECGSLSDKADVILSIIKEISPVDEKQIKSRIDYRNKLIAKEKSGTITAGERLELNEKQFDVREYPKRIKNYDLFVPSKYNASDTAGLPYTHIGTLPEDRNNFVVVYDDGYTRWQAEGEHWDKFVALKYDEFRKNGQLHQVLQKLETYNRELESLFYQAQEQIENMPREQIKDDYAKQIATEGIYYPNVSPRDILNFLYKPETLSSEEKGQILFELAKSRYLEQRCIGDRGLLPIASFH